MSPSSDTGRSRLWAIALGVLAVVVAAVPFALNASSLGIALGLTVAALFGVAAFTVASEGDLDGPPPRRSA